MSTIIKPESYFDEQRPIEFTPFFNPKSGQFQYWERLDTTRVRSDTLTFVSGAVYKKPRNFKLKLQISIDVDAKPMMHIGNLTTFTNVETTRAFRRQLKIVYGTGRREDIAYFCWHEGKVNKFIEKNKDAELTIQHGIPVSSGNKNNPLTKELMKDAIVTIIKLGDAIVACIVSIGQFNKAYLFEEFDSTRAKKELRSGVQRPIALFHDHMGDE